MSRSNGEPDEMRCARAAHVEEAAQRGRGLVERVPVEHVAAVDLDRREAVAEVACERGAQLGPHDLLLLGDDQEARPLGVRDRRRLASHLAPARDRRAAVDSACGSGRRAPGRRCRWTSSVASAPTVARGPRCASRAPRRGRPSPRPRSCRRRASASTRRAARSRDRAARGAPRARARSRAGAGRSCRRRSGRPRRRGRRPRRRASRAGRRRGARRPGAVPGRAAVAAQVDREPAALGEGLLREAAVALAVGGDAVDRERGSAVRRAVVMKIENSHRALA